MKCPNCKMKQYWCCSNLKCSCRENMLIGELPQIQLENDLVQCPYCFHIEHMDYYEELAMKELVNE